MAFSFAPPLFLFLFCASANPRIPVYWLPGVLCFLKHLMYLPVQLPLAKKHHRGIAEKILNLSVILQPEREGQFYSGGQSLSSCNYVRMYEHSFSKQIFF